MDSLAQIHRAECAKLPIADVLNVGGLHERVTRAFWIGLALSAAVSCAGTTGESLHDFPAAAAGPSEARAGTALAFTNDHGWHVVLTQATLHVGAIYLDQSRPVAGAGVTACYLPGVYVAEATSGLDVDLLSSELQRFGGLAHGSTLQAIVGQVWLTGADVNSPVDATKILTIAGTADQGAVTLPFHGTITISSNRASAGTTAAGAAPICKQRIVSPIPTAVRVQDHGGLLLRVDPRALFVNVDFGTLAPATTGCGSAASCLAFSDDPGSSSYGQADRNLYLNLHSTADPATTTLALYTFIWSNDL
ncbi:MAG TPA: hypothetical protein VGI10_03575 [Polyangiaceae bacterium]